MTEKRCKYDGYICITHQGMCDGINYESVISMLQNTLNGRIRQYEYKMMKSGSENMVRYYRGAIHEAKVVLDLLKEHTKMT